MAEDASTAAANPAAMTRLDSSQMLAAAQAIYIDLQFDRQYRVATGIQYDWNEKVNIGAAYQYLDAGKAKIDQQGGPLQGPLKGEYDTNVIHVVAANLSWKF